MKISQVIALSLTMASTHALAFQAKEAGSLTPANQKVSDIEHRIISQLYRQHSNPPQVTAPGTCAAVPVSGCNCPFCTQLRSQGA